jgi:hypothetical protein
MNINFVCRLDTRSGRLHRAYAILLQRCCLSLRRGHSSLLSRRNDRLKSGRHTGMNVRSSQTTLFHRISLNASISHMWLEDNHAFLAACMSPEKRDFLFHVGVWFNRWSSTPRALGTTAQKCDDWRRTPQEDTAIQAYSARGISRREQKSTYDPENMSN